MKTLLSIGAGILVLIVLPVFAQVTVDNCPAMPNDWGVYECQGPITYDPSGGGKQKLIYGQFPPANSAPYSPSIRISYGDQDSGSSGPIAVTNAITQEYTNDISNVTYSYTPEANVVSFTVTAKSTGISTNYSFVISNLLQSLNTVPSITITAQGGYAGSGTVSAQYVSPADDYGGGSAVNPQTTTLTSIGDYNFWSSHNYRSSTEYNGKLEPMPLIQFGAYHGKSDTVVGVTLYNYSAMTPSEWMIEITFGRCNGYLTCQGQQ